MEGYISARKMTAYLAMHRKFHFGIYSAAQMPILGELVENLWLRCGPTLGFVVPEYVLLLKGTDHHKSVPMERRDGNKAKRAIIADIMDASAYLETLAGSDGIIRAPRGSSMQRA